MTVKCIQNVDVFDVIVLILIETLEWNTAQYVAVR